MRILHTGDWHIGRSLFGVPLLEAQEHFLAWLADLVTERRVDAVLVAGDVYDRALPGVEAVQALEAGLEALSRRAPVVMIPGNHDSAQRLGFGAGWFTDRLRIRARVSQVAEPVVIPDADGGPGLWVYAVPYLDPDLAGPAVAALAGDPGAELPRSHEAVMRAVTDAIRDDLARRRGPVAPGEPRPAAVLTAHAFVGGGTASESERDIRVGGVDVIPSEVFAGFDYVALGHLHGPQAVGTPDGTIRYAGSPLAFSFSERDHTKSVAVVDFDAQGRCADVEVVPTPVPRRLSDVTGTLEEVLSLRFASQRDDWTRITVRGAARPDNLLATLRGVFPHVLEHHFEPLAAATTARAGVGRDLVDPVSVAGEFVRQATGAPPTPAETTVLNEAYALARAREGGR